jgi:hypothetical protein
VIRDVPVTDTLNDPTYIMSAEEVQRNAEEDYRAAHPSERSAQVIPPDIVQAPAPQRVVVKLNVGEDGQFREPNLLAYVNHCGPSAAQVALRAALRTIPVLDHLATLMKTNVNKKGTYLQDLCQVLNSQLAAAKISQSYLISYHNSITKPQFANNLGSAIDQGKPVVTVIDTWHMAGWSVRAAHIVTIYGYEATVTPGRSGGALDTISLCRDGLPPRRLQRPLFCQGYA